MIRIKSAREIALMREAGHIVAATHQALREHIKAGISTLELDSIAEKTIRELGGVPSFKGYNGFPGSICTSINETVIHGIPDSRTLKEGDIIAIDIGASYQGYHGDSAWTYPVGKISSDDSLLLKVTEDALWEGLKQVKSGNHLSDIGNAISSFVKKYGFSIVEEFTGHGVGRDLHEDPAIPNFGYPKQGPILKSGMTLAIEPMVNAGKKQVKVLLDNWTTVTRDMKKSAHFEHSVLVTEEGFEILTKIKEAL